MADRRTRRRVAARITTQLRELRLQLATLNHHVGSSAELRDSDLDCLDHIARSSGIGPSALARQLGVHPATLTGVLDRLESTGWIRRRREETDRRAVSLTVPPERQRQLLGLFSGMNEQMATVCSVYSESELELISDFLNATLRAGVSATNQLKSPREAPKDL